MGVMTMPAKAPMAADRAKESRIILFTSIPTRLAASALSAQALIALPIMVLSKKKVKATAVRIKKPKIQKYWG
jgi:hypothetical protein